MRTSIGNAAGFVWKELNESCGSTLSELRKKGAAEGFSGDVVDFAVGWLAKENKVEFSKKGRSTFLRLLG